MTPCRDPDEREYDAWATGFAAGVLFSLVLVALISDLRVIGGLSR